jgi:prophage tail gpP-like protein
MADTSSPALTVEFEDTGEKWTNVTDYSIQSSFTVPTDGWSFTAFDPDPIKLRRLFSPLRPVKLYIGDRLQVIGRIDATEGTGGGSAALRVQGRDYLANIVSGTIDPTVSVTSNMSLADAILAGLYVFGFDTVEASDAAVTVRKTGARTAKLYRAEVAGLGALAALATGSTARGIQVRDRIEGALDRLIGSAGTVTLPTTTGKVGDFKPQDGEGAFQWCDRLAARQGFCVQPGSSRTSIAVTRPNFDGQPIFTLKRPGNIEDATASRNYGDLPTVTITRGRAVSSTDAKGGFRQMPASGDGSPSTLWALPEGQRIMGGDVVEGRPPGKLRVRPPKHYLPAYRTDKESRTTEELDKAARRFLADRMRDTLEYTCTVSGHIDPISGATWATNTMAAVSDSIEDVDEVLWIVDTELSYSRGTGQQTHLTLIRPASYVL